jgi:N,N'-diacetyllegionaminate synthase
MKPILIAECCQNHSGDRETLKRMIHAAVDSGADYVKLQALYSHEVAYRERFEEGRTNKDGSVGVIKRPYQAEVDRLAGLDLTPDDEAWFVDECLRAGGAPMITAFTRTGIERIRDMGFEAVKVASYDCRSYPLLRDLRKWWSTLFVSTGATYDAEIERAAEVLEGSNYSFLHCVTIYPTPLEEMHLRRMNFLRRFTPHVGFSDHSKPEATGLCASKIAIALGASCVERHFTIEDSSATRDGPVSVTPAMLADLRKFSDLPRPERMELVKKEYPNWQEALGKTRRALSPAELLNRDYYCGRVASKVAGETIFNWEDIEISNNA